MFTSQGATITSASRAPQNIPKSTCFAGAKHPLFDEVAGLPTKCANDGHPNSMAELGQRMYYGDEMDQDKAGGLDMLPNAPKTGRTLRITFS